MSRKQKRLLVLCNYSGGFAAGKKELFVVDDKVGTPTYTVDFANALHRLLESDQYGVYNHSGEGRCSRYDVAVEFLRVLELDSQIAVSKVDSSFFAADYFAVRPASEALINLKIRSRGLNAMRDWRTSLTEYAQVFRSDLTLHGSHRG